MNETPGDRPLVTARGVTRTYRLGRRDVEVLRGVDLAIPRGALVALQGASGAGKSTLLHLLGGLDVPTAGHIEFAGQCLEALSPRALALVRNRFGGELTCHSSVIARQGFGGARCQRM